MEKALTVVLRGSPLGAKTLSLPADPDPAPKEVVATRTSGLRVR